MRFAAVLLLVGSCTATFADDCSTVIALSRVKAVSISDQSAVEANANNFCSEYSSSNGHSNSANFGASYSFLAASFGSSSASVQQVAGKYCSASSGYATSADAYKNYVETVAPGAYGAYQACVQSSNNNLKYSVDLASVLEHSFAISASFAYVEGANPAEVKYVAGPGVRCQWDNTSNVRTNIGTGHSGILQCSRTDSSHDTYVTVQMITAPVSPLTLHWPAYKDGVPASALLDLQRTLATLARQVQDLKPQFFTVPYSTMVTLHPGCTDSDAATHGALGCAAAAASFCTSKGFAGGFPQQTSRDELAFLCVK